MKKNLNYVPHFFIVILLVISFYSTCAQTTSPILINGNSKFSNSKERKVTLFINMPKAKEMMISNSEGFDESQWEVYTNSREWILSEGEGVKNVFVKFKDQANKESSVFKSSIILDFTPPKVKQMMINGDANFVNNPLKEAMLRFEVEEAISMRVSNEDKFEVSRWVPFKDSLRWVLPGNDGVKSVYAQFQDKAGNISETVNDDIILDRLPPTNLSMIINDGATLTGNSKIKLKISAKDAREMMIKQLGGNWLPYKEVVEEVELKGGDGLHTVMAKFRDEAGNVSIPVSARITLDRKGPQNGKIMIDNNAVYTSAPSKKVNLRIYAEDAFEMAFGEDSTFAAISWEPYKVVASISLSGEDGKKKVFAKFRDKAGNESSVAKDEIILDRSKPEPGTLSINKGQDVTNNPSVTLSLQSPDARQMMISSNDAFMGVLWERYEPVKNFVLQGQDGEKVIYAKFKDAAGNISDIISSSIILDRKASGNARLKIDNGMPYTTNKDGKVTLSFEADGVAEMMISNTNDFKGAVWQPFTHTIDWKLSGEDGLKVVGVKFKDKAGNESPVVTARIKLAKSASVSGGFTINHDSLITRNLNKRVDLLIKSQGAKEMMIANTAEFQDGKWEEVKSEKVWALAGEDGEKTVYLKFRGFVGNESPVYTDKIILDRTGPLNGRIRMMIDSVNFKKSGLAHLQIFASDAAYMMLSNNPVFQGAKWETYKSAKEWRLDKEDGIKNIYVKFRDQIGNESDVYSDRVLMDKTPPKNVALKINNGADYTNNKDKAVTLVFIQDDAAFVRVSNSPNIEKGEWEKASLKKLNWILPGEDGEKTVYVQFMDEGKNISSVVFDKIILDRKPPSDCSFTINNDSTITNNKEADVQLYIKGKEAKSILISNSRDFFGARWEAFKPFKKDWILDGPDGEKTVYMLFKDDAGNLFPDTLSHKIILDRTPPTNLLATFKEGKITPEMNRATLILKAQDAEMMEILIGEGKSVSWVPFKESFEIDLPEGERNVRVRFKDHAGNASEFVDVSSSIQ
jgi:hypothetical protein